MEKTSSSGGAGDGLEHVVGVEVGYADGAVEGEAEENTRKFAQNLGELNGEYEHK